MKLLKFEERTMEPSNLKKEQSTFELWGARSLQTWRRNTNSLNFEKERRSLRTWRMNDEPSKLEEGTLLSLRILRRSDRAFKLEERATKLSHLRDQRRSLCTWRTSDEPLKLETKNSSNLKKERWILRIGKSDRVFKLGRERRSLQTLKEERQCLQTWGRIMEPLNFENERRSIRT